MNNPFDPLTPVKGESGIFTTAVRKSTLPKTGSAPVQPLAPAAMPPPPEGFVLDQPATPPVQSAIPPPPPGFVMDTISTPPPAVTAPSLPANIPPPEPVQVAPQSAAAATSAAFAAPKPDNWQDAIKQGFKTLSFLPFSDTTQLADAAFLLNAARKVERGEATYEDEEMLNDYLQKAQREKTPGYEIVQGIMKLPAFAGELGLTAGAYTAGKTVTMKALKKALGKYAETIAARAGGAAAGVAAQTAASSAPRIAAGTIQNVTPTFGLNFEEGDENIKITKDQDPLAKALVRSFAEQALQVGSERVGSLLDKTPPGKVFQAALRRYLKINPGKRVEDFMDVVRNKGLRNSFVTETIEEEIIKPVEVLTGVGTQLRGDENTMENRFKEQYSWKQFLIQSATLAVPGAGGVMMNKLFTVKPPKDPANPTADEIKDRIKAIGIPEEMLGDLPDRLAAAKTPEERDKVVAEFAAKFKDAVPETPQDAAQGAQLEFLAGEIGKVRATAGDSAASYFEEKYLNRVKSGQVLTSEQQTIAGQEMLRAIEDSKAGKSFQAPLQEPAMSDVGRAPAEPVAAQPAPANEIISPPPAPTTQDKAGTLAPVAAGASETPISPTEAGAGAPLTSPAAQPKNITPLGAGQPPITISGAEPGTSLGTETKVHGTKGQDYNARYAVMPRSKLVASHDGITFSKNPEYPLENARDYSNPAEKAKVLKVRNEFTPDRHVTDSTDASVGPVMVAGVTDEKGVRRVVVLGGNNREMAIQTMTPEKRQQLADFTNQRSDRFGLPKLPDAEHELVRFMGEYDLRQQGTREKLQEIIDALNPSPGKVQSQSEMAAVDAGNISIDRLNDVSMDVSPKAAAAKIMDLIADKTLDANLRSQISEHPDQAKEYLRRVLVNAAFRDRNIADFISVSDTKSATARGLIEAATQSVVDLRAKGQNELADAFSRSMATVVEYVQSGDDLRTALFRAAKQMEMDPKMAIVQEVAETMRRNVALSPKKKIIAEDSVENFKNVWNQISEGLKKWDSKPDMFGTTTTADDVIRNIMTKIRQEQQFNNGEIRTSTRQPKSAGPYRTIKAKQGQYLIDEMMNAWANKPMGGAIVVQSEADLDALNLSDESRNEIRNSKAEGFYHIPTETVVIIADNLQRPSDAIRVMLHESIGHFGIQKVLGEEFEKELVRIGKLIPAAELARAKELYGDKLAVEEYLANEASTRNPTLWQEFIKAIRAALKRIGVNDHILDKWDKRNEIERLIDTAREFVEKGEAKPAEAMSGEIRMSVPQEDTREFKLEQLTPDQMRSEETLRKQNEEARRRKEKLDELAAKPIKGTAGDMNLNLFPGEGDLFTRRQQYDRGEGTASVDMSNYQEIKENEISNSDVQRIISRLALDFNRPRTSVSMQLYRSKQMRDIGVGDPRRMGGIAAEKIAKIFGKDLIFFRSNIPTYGLSTNIVKDKIFISVDSPRPQLAVVGHELIHEMRKDEPELYEQFEKELFKYVSNYESYQRRRTNPSMSEGELKLDFIPDIVGDQMVSPEFWSEMEKKNPTFFGKIASYVLQFIQKIQARVYGTDRNFLLNDLGKARSIIADYVSKYAEIRQTFNATDDIRMSKPAEGEKADTDQHKFSERVSLDPRMTPDLRKAMADRLYETRHNKELIETVMARIDKGLDAAETDFYKPESDLKPDERVAIGQVLMQAHNEAARTATAAKDETTTRKHLNEAISVGRQLDELGLQYGRGAQAFAIWNETLSTAEGAQRMFARTKDKAIDEVLNRSGKDIEAVKKVVVEGNAEAIDETLIEERVQERINTILSRLGSNARNGLPDRMKTKAGKQAAQDYFSLPENSATNDPDLRFSKAGEELDKKLFAAAKYGARVMWQAGSISFSDFSAAMIKKSGPNIEKYLPRIYNEASILLNNVVSRKPVSKKGKDTRKDRAVGAEINAILKDWFAGDPNAERQPVIDLLKAAGMSERSAVDLVMGVQHRFIEKAQRAKERRINELTSGRIIPLTNPKAIRQLLELSNLTPLTDDVIRAGIAKAYGLPELTPEVAGRLDEMAKAIRDAADGFQKDDATRSMLNYIRKQMPKSISDVGWSMWYANILSGYQTAERNFSGNAFNALDNLAASMVAEPRNAPFALWGFIRGINVGAQSAVDVLQTGNFPVRGNKYEASSVLELNPFTGIFKVFNAWKYVMRSLYAADMLFFKPAQESRAMMIAADLARKEGLSGRELWRRAAQIMGRTAIQGQAFRRQAMDEGLTGLNVKKRVQEIAEQQRPEELISEPMDYAQRVTFNYQPEGQIGILAKKISDASKDVPLLRLAVPFTRIVANVANTTIDHTPWGFVRAMRGMRDVHGNLQPITGHRRAQLVAKATMGTAAMAAVYVLDRMGDGDDDDKKKFAIYAAGPGTTSKRRQLEETGWKPYTIRIGKRYFDYRLTPLAIPFAIIGHVRDAERWRKLDEKSIWSRMSYAVVKSGATIFDMSFLSGVNQLVNFIQRDTADSAGNALQSYLSRNASTVIPALLKQIDKTFDDQVRDNATIQEGLLREIPIVSHQVKPKLNLLGEPIQQTAGPGSIFFSKERSDPVWKLIVEKEAWISQPAKDTKLGDGIMDQDEYYEYVKESGQIIRRQIEERLPALQEASKERAGKIIDDITRRARDIAKNKIARERLNK